MKLKKFLKAVGKNLLAALAGAVIGSIVSVLYGLNVWLPQQTEKLSSGAGILFGAIALIPVIVILFGFIGLVIGAIIGILIYQIVRRRKKK